MCFGNFILISLVSMGQFRPDIARTCCQGYINLESCYKFVILTPLAVLLSSSESLSTFTKEDSSFEAIFATKQEQNGKIS